MEPLAAERPSTLGAYVMKGLAKRSLPQRLHDQALEVFDIAAHQFCWWTAQLFVEDRLGQAPSLPQSFRNKTQELLLDLCSAVFATAGQ